MPVELESGTAIKRWRGLSSDTKPRYTEEDQVRTEIPVGSQFRETDTGRRYVWSERDGWELENQTIEALFAEMNGNLAQLIELQRQANVGLGLSLGINLFDC